MNDKTSRCNFMKAITAGSLAPCFPDTTAVASPKGGPASQGLNGESTFDYMRFYPPYFQNVERCVSELRDLGIQADLILFNSYNKPGRSFSKMELP